MKLFLATATLGAAALGGAAYVVRQWRRERFAHVLDHGSDVQLAADGRLALTAVQQRDPDFSEDAFLERAAEFQERFYQAWTAGDLTPVRGVLLPGMRDRLDLDLDMHRALLRKPEVYDITVAEAHVVEAVHDGFYDTVYVRLTGDAMIRTMHGGTNRWLSGGVNPDPFEEIWGFTRRSNVTSRKGPGTLEGFCPTCGADLLAGTPASRCPECGVALDDGSQDWAVSFFGRAEAWRPSDVPPPEAGTEGESLARILDRTTGAFWRLRSAVLHADESRLEGVATPDFIARHASEFRATRDGRHAFHALAALGRMEWLGYSEEHAWVRVHWSGIPVQARVPAFTQDDPSRVSPCADDFVLARGLGSEGWRVEEIHRVLGEVPCSDLLDELDETRRLERLPVTTRFDREALLQVVVVLLLRSGPLTGGRLSRLAAAGILFGIGAERMPVLVRQVEHEGAVLFGRECKLPPETLFRHLARVAVSCGAMRPAVLRMLRDVAQALGVEAAWKMVIETERRMLADVVVRIERAGRRR